MEFTLEDTQKKIDENLLAHPELGVVAKRVKETSLLKELLVFNGIDSRHLSDIEFELLMVVALYVPLSELSKNITEGTGIPSTESMKLVNMIEAILLDDVIQNLRAYDIVLHSEESEEMIPESNLETKERLELRPEPQPSWSTGAPVEAEKPAPGADAKPLTREELMNALGGKRTMAADIEALRQKREGAKGTPTSTPPVAPPPPQAQ